MELTSTQTFIMILSIALGAAITRFLPFLLFPENKKPPETISYLGRVLPPAMMGLLVIYCFKNVSFLSKPHGIPEFVAILVIAALHFWKRNVLLSIGGGTIIYMFLVQKIL